MLEMIAILLLYQLMGEVLVVFFQWPLPGPVLGMALLFLTLLLKGSIPPSLEQVSRGLLENLSLLFVPAGVGVMTHLALLDKHWTALTFALVLSTVTTLGITGWTMQWLMRRQDQSETGS